jgi:hypothetical protein
MFKANYSLSAFYFIQLLVIIFVAKSFSLPVSTSYITRDQLLINAYGKNALSASTAHIFDVNVKSLIVFMLILLVIIYVWLASRYRYNYETDLKRESNPARWIHTGFINGLMMVAVGLLAGVYDLVTLIVLFILPIITNLIFIIKEQLPEQEKLKHNLLMILKLATAILPLAIILCYVLSADIYGTHGMGTYFYFLYATVTIYYVGTFVNQLLLSKKTKSWKKYIYGEQIHLLLGVIFTTAVIWQIFVGVLH